MSPISKNELHQHCLQQVQGQVSQLLAIQAELKEALGSESKSTAGDKHETGRAMIQLEMERAGHQLEQAEQLLAALQAINPELVNDTVQLGSLVQTDRGVFYVSVGLGRVLFDGETCFVVSPTAPVAKVLLGKWAGEQASFNGQEIKLLQVG